MQENVITFEHVSKDYVLYKNEQERFWSLFHKKKNLKQHQALRDISFSIKKGEAVAIIGNNGAGKSTLLKMITGVTYPTMGKVTVHGRVAALLELTAGFSGDLSGRENIYLKGNILGLSAKEISAIEEAIILFADLGEYIDQPVRTYSSGMKMRLGFAININIQPDILVIDEALSVGDASFKKKCNQKIAEIIEQGITVLFVSHDKKSVKELCTRAIYLQKGVLVFDGPVEEAMKLYK